MTHAWTLLFTAAWCATAAACPLERIEAALAEPLDGLKRIEREVSDIQSTEGGVWQIFREKDGRVHTILRIDGGESGRSETRLSVVDRKTYGIAVTRLDYIRHAFLEGPFAVARRTTDSFFFCGGKPYVPPPDSAAVDLEAYPKAAAEAQRAILGSKDIAEFTKGLAR